MPRPETLVDGLIRAAEALPDRGALVLGPRTVTYAQLATMAAALAAHLREGGLALGDRVAILGRNSPEFVAAYYGIQAAGGVVVALGKVLGGMWCDDDRLRSRVLDAAARTGERVWRLPHDPAYRDMMKSPIADIVNSAPVREAHPIQGAAFLSYFVDEGIPWCHLDIAGVHAVDKAQDPFIAGPTGFGARLLARLAELA